MSKIFRKDKRKKKKIKKKKKDRKEWMDSVSITSISFQFKYENVFVQGEDHTSNIYDN